MRARAAIISCLVWALVFCPASQSLATVVCPSGETQQGVDVSWWQGTVNWGQVAASGVTFAFARVSDGLTADGRFASNYAGIKTAGMIRGAYQFFRPGQDALAQSDLFLSSIGTIGPGDLPPALDVEITDGMSAVAVGQAVETWATAIQQATGRTPLIFTSRNFWDDHVISPDSALNPLWIAAWGVACPDTPSIWDNWVFWQYSGDGSVPGIVGLVSLDVFNGPLSELQELAGMAPVGVPGAQATVPRLYPNHPNPFNPRTTIRFDLPAAGQVRLVVYDLAGRLVRVLVEGEVSAGSHEAVWDGRDATGRARTLGHLPGPAGRGGEGGGGEVESCEVSGA